MEPHNYPYCLFNITEEISEFVFIYVLLSLTVTRHSLLPMLPNHDQLGEYSVVCDADIFSLESEQDVPEYLNSCDWVQN